MKKRDVLLTTEAHRDAWNDFHAAIEDAARREGWRSAEVMRNFLEAGFLAIRGRYMTGEPFDTNEAAYMAVVKRCRRPKETMTNLSVMLGCLGRAMIAEPVDFLGPIFSHTSASTEMGQFFTPYHVSYMMAKMTLGDPRSLFGEKGYVSLHEPACGCGGMVLAANVALREAGVDVAREAHWMAIDIDVHAVHACYLQLAMSDCSAAVYRGNALGNPAEWTGTLTPAALLFPKRAPDKPPVDQPTPPLPVPAEPVPAPSQLSLF